MRGSRKSVGKSCTLQSSARAKKGSRIWRLWLKFCDAASVIVNMARARNTDLIVLDRRGLGTLAGLPLGSVSHKVTQMADRPCLTVA